MWYLQVRMAALGLLLSAAFAAGAAAQIVNQVPVGARAIGMGGAFSAVADDGTALFWNTAGLAQIGHQEIRGAYANLYGTDIRDNDVSFVLPLSPGQAAAAEWYHSGQDDGELAWGENRLSLAYSLKVHPKVYVGGAGKFLTRSTSSDGTDVRKGTGLGADFGVLATPWRGLRLGLVLQDAFDTSIDDNTTGQGVAYPRTVRLASAWNFGRLGYVAFDLDDRWHLGVEALPVEAVALRAGVQDDIDGYERATWSFGAGFKAGIFRVDYAREFPPSLDPTDHLSLALEFNFNPAQIRIEKVEAGDVYLSQMKRYSSEPFGTIQVRNLQEEPLEAQLSVFAPDLMDAPSVQPLVLRPKAVQTIPLTAVFSDRTLTRSGDRAVQVEVSASYQSSRLMREDKSAARVIAYGPGAINWGEGVGQAAAFVTTVDPAVDALARAASRTVVRMGTNPFRNRNLNFAAAMTDVLASAGLAYVPDPNNPYSTISETQHAVDTIHYPYETLQSLTGDCDDSTVLMAALLENVGVPTKFVDAPGHLTLVVGTGVNERNRLALGLPEEYYVVSDGELWVPIETTAISQGFARAWQVGAESYAGWEARGRVQLVDVKTAQSQYEPTVPPGSRNTLEVDEDDLRTRLEVDADIVEGWRRDFMSSNFGDVEDMRASEEALVSVAHVYFLAGSYDEAQRRLDEALGSHPGSARIHNDLALIAAAQGDLAAAETQLVNALDYDDADGGCWLNLGLVRYVRADTLGAREPIERGLALVGGFDAAVELLGLGGAGAPDVGESSGSVTAEEARLLLIEAIERAPGADEGSQRVGVQGDGKTATQGGDGPLVRNPAVRAEAASRIQQYMYWRK